MASNGTEHHLANEVDMVHLRLTVMSEDGATVPSEELQGKTFLMSDRDEPSGYLAKSVKTTGRVTNLYCLQAPS